ncbi:hypothetical protein BU25DRAFT_443147 [Macroventuria anomochaeta]|uniref:Uncharacterized protein n=1 Tax=Macroventuria anomochaeta TaxID=301207 RepID=A0ACB6RKN4_9PLEO|nr:uncharacterized protein BU25DRAFT_443147 [Macroventuria anomochaeta]KAF2622485.1 hypothetical protein BU25DRAFT_443147 [Macroventuria anomochaeta]
MIARPVLASASPLASLDGFPSLAQFIASDPDHTSLVFRRLDRLAARNLLYIQSELVELETLRDHKGEALLFESTLATPKAPPVRTFESFMNTSTRPADDTYQRDSIFGGHSAKLYSTNEDLVLLRVFEHSDRLTAFPEDRMPIFFMSGRSSNDMAYASQRGIARFVTIVSIILSVVLLFSAINTLFQHDEKLIVVGMYVILFASSVGLLTTAKKADIFAATAAYAAVLVVLVSGNLGSASCEASGQV